MFNNSVRNFYFILSLSSLFLRLFPFFVISFLFIVFISQENSLLVSRFRAQKKPQLLDQRTPNVLMICKLDRIYCAH